MKFLGNILWLIMGGLVVSLYYALMGVLFCITVIGIPFGLQLIKMAGLALWPFGRDVHSDSNDGGCLSIIMNVIWIIFGGIEIALLHVGFGIICCLTIVGIPFGMQHFKMAILAFIPFGKKIS
ncbi:MAG: YccF domain-containing protein [Bacteroidales bacterium]|nr:YccF domain-containing protein [Bacteroidales bacterium]